MIVPLNTIVNYDKIDYHLKAVGIRGIHLRKSGKKSAVEITVPDELFGRLRVGNYTQFYIGDIGRQGLQLCVLDLNNRMAVCEVCGAKKPSSLRLPWYQYRGNDTYYPLVLCKQCGYTRERHGELNNLLVCRNFTPLVEANDIFNCCAK